MKIVILTIGTRGDVEPHVALGSGLRDAGHAVTICTSESFRELIDAHGLDYGYMSDRHLDFLTQHGVRDAADVERSRWDLLKAAPDTWRRARSVLRQRLDEQWAAAQGADAIIYHAMAKEGFHIAERLRVPALVSTVYPSHVPTRDYAHFMLPDLKLGGWYNRLTYSTFSVCNRALYGGVINAWRRETLGLPPRSRFAGELSLGDGRPIPVIHGYSEHVVPRPRDWPATAVETGYWFLDHGDCWQPPADLVEFLESGSPPVFVGFGSMAGRDPRRLTEMVLEALARCGRRGLIASGWGGLQASELPGDIFQIEAAPHAWLFPRMAAVVHHGGAGTTAAGLRAGKPTLICPFLGDQPFWGRRVDELGVGPPPIPQRRLTADGLTDAIAQATTDERMRERAHDLGREIRAEDGVANAVAFVGEHLCAPAPA